MAHDLHFLSRTSPLLPCAALWLRDRYACVDVLDLSSTVVVTPGARAGRRVLELLLQKGGMVVPPRFVTTGSLPELLFEPVRPLAPALLSSLAWSSAFRSLTARDLGKLLPSPPAKDDPVAWMKLGDEIGQLYDTLAADSVTAANVADDWNKQNEKDEEARWKALDAVRRAYLTILEKAGYADRNQARVTALRKDACRFDRSIIMIGVSDLPKTAASMLAQVAKVTEVHTLVAAPESERAYFDSFGRPIPDHWTTRNIALRPERLIVADRPRDIAGVVIEELANRHNPLDPESVTICCGDETQMHPLARTLALANIPCHAATGMPLNRTAPVLAISALGRFSSSHSLTELLSLVRHPDIADGISASLPRAEFKEDWLAQLETYACEHVPVGLPKIWIPDESHYSKYDSALLTSVGKSILSLLPKEKSQPLPRWTSSLRKILARLYAQDSAFAPRAADALDAIADELEAWNVLPASGALAAPFTFAQAAVLLDARLALSQTPADPADPSIELLGWLETPLDDAANLIITGLNEGIIPASRESDVFLSDTLRVKLGMAGNAQRHARDAFHLVTILDSRPDVLLVSLRHDAEGNPLLPSRLLLAAPVEELISRVRPFAGLEPAMRSRFRFLAAGHESRFLIPHPTEPQQPITSLNVTAFKDYLACPYRFYLKYVLGLGEPESPGGEINAMVFGTLAHKVLEEFGRTALAQNDLRHCDDASRIRAFLRDDLNRRAKEIFGNDAAPAVALQLAMLKIRLDRFSDAQAEMVAEGWEIKCVELNVKDASFDVDGVSFGLRGRIDRIDTHKNGGIRILDYKSGDSAMTPKQTHLSKEDWIDLQLPLYSILAKHAKFEGDFTYGYILLSKDAGKSGLSLADWDENVIESAIEKARDVAHCIRQNIFWPPAVLDSWKKKGAPEFSAESALLHEGSLARMDVIRRTQELSSFTLPKSEDER